MATDPVRRIRRAVDDTAIELNLHDLLEDLAAFPPSPHIPYLTVSLDNSPIGSAPGLTLATEVKPSAPRAGSASATSTTRPGRTIFEHQFGEIIANYAPRSDARASLTADRDRLLAYFDNELDPATMGLFVVACSALDVFEAIPLGLALETRAAAGPTPDLSLLAQLIDDHPTFGVLLADQINAVLSLFNQNQRTEATTIEADQFPRKHKSNFLNDYRYANRAQERTNAFARVVADETRQVVERHHLDMLVLAGDHEIMNLVKSELHPTIAEKVIGSVPMHVEASRQEQLEAVESLVIQAERDQEAAAVEQLASRIGADDRAVAGIDGVLRALQQGSVRTLIIADDLEGTGWGDFALNIFGSGPVPMEHPTGGNPNDLVALDIDEELVRLAVTTGAEIQFIHTGRTEPPAPGQPNRSDAAIKLDEFSGVGALLRFDI